MPVWAWVLAARAELLAARAREVLAAKWRSGASKSLVGLKATRVKDESNPSYL